MTSSELRKKFFEYFSNHGHTKVVSSSLIPANDPTLLFANAGMNQFKDIFLGREEPQYKRAVSIQKCIRAGGKHNDLENVGFTQRHLTFFEMMGNFSFGDYFKKEAIQYAWDFLTQVLKLDKEKLLVTVYHKDTESYDIWHKVIKLPAERIFTCGESDNFWQMGDTGPCGPCTEIFVDRGVSFACGSKGCNPVDSCDRFLEIWNLVFMQYDRLPDGSDRPLKNLGVDTGMGLERLCAVVQEKESVFETDLFIPLIKRIEELTDLNYETANPEIQAAFRVLADHIRSVSFAIADGVTPSNEGREYVIRKIIRRAALFAQKLGRETLFPEIVPTLVESMSPIYPELKVQEPTIVNLVTHEVEKFQKTFAHGQRILTKYLRASEPSKVLSGEHAFMLYDTYGFPLEVTKILADEQGFSVDSRGFDEHMERQRKRSGKKARDTECDLDESIRTVFTGYEEHQSTAKIVGLVVDKKQVHNVREGTQVYVITDVSPFFVECGGQISDQGFIQVGSKEAPLRGLKKIGDAIGALIKAPTTLQVGDMVTLIVDSPSRMNTMKNHTATHLLQAALKELLGNQIQQSGSVVTPDYLRFDFTYQEPLTPEQIKFIEHRVNEKILENSPIMVDYAPLKEALERGVIALFDEKYRPEKVRIITIPEFSSELCGGTHVSATGDIGCFKITEESALSSGNRRIVAVTGSSAVALFQQTFTSLKTLGQEFKVPIDQVLDAVMRQKEHLKDAQSTIKELKRALFKTYIPQLISKIEHYGPVPFLFLMLDTVDSEDLKEIGTYLMNEKAGFYVLIASKKERSPFIATLAPSLTHVINLEQFSTWLKEQGIRGGGKETILQGSILSQDVPNLETQIKKWLQESLQ